ncbi:UNVERIFIED_ORG: PAS domain S-box-containing protein [Zoogloea ramigera]|uniref:histidine kinase n=1 Tax=Duganella zoogloeoides TaxID=75659 RepID=A0ABZ0Y2T8_9BURK|nr:ATP-binding protein [Duganella zoogloeoides]WQH06315.1 ATP-binding protein [Duganella zoogloeoides]
MTVETSLVVQALPFAILVLDASPEFVILHGSDEYLAATMTSRADVIGRPLFEAFPASSSDADGPDRLCASLHEVLRTRRLHTMDLQRYDVPDRKGDGFIVKYWLPTNLPVLDADGQVVAIIHRVYDMTALVGGDNALPPGDPSEHVKRSFDDLKRVIEVVKEGERRRTAAEARATEAGERLDLAVQAGELGTFYCPMPMDKIYWNDTCKEHFFLPLDAEVDFDLFYARIHPDDRAHTQAAVEASVRDKQMYDVEYRVVAPDGRERWLRAKGRTYFDAHGAPTRFDGITLDISRQKQVEAELSRSNRQKDDFLAMLAHELRNPLAPISAAADLLAIAPPDPARIARMSEVLSRQARHMSGMLDDLLDVSRVTRGMVELDRVVVDCKHVVAAALEQVTPLIEQRGHRVHTHITHEGTLVLGDEKRLVQVLANLLGNAARYTPVSGRIEVALTVAGNNVVVSVADNGVGLDRELVPRIFELFVQAARTPDRAQGGLGLGLALVRSMVELHGGRVAAASPGEGQGATFTAWLPRHQAAPQDAAPVGGHRFDAAQPLKIVVVDDNVDAAWTLATCLRAIGHDVVEINSPKAALALAPEHAPDVFLLDIGMPEMDGRELARRLRAQPHTASARLIAVTGYANPEEADTPFDRYLVKPVDFPALARMLEQPA